MEKNYRAGNTSYYSDLEDNIYKQVFDYQK